MATSAFDKAGLLQAWDPAFQRTAMGRVAELFSNVADPRLLDDQYARIASELEQHPSFEHADGGDGDLWSLAELAEGRSEEDVLNNL